MALGGLLARVWLDEMMRGHSCLPGARPLMRPQRGCDRSGRAQFGSYHYFRWRQSGGAISRTAVLATALLGDTLYSLPLFFLLAPASRRGFSFSLTHTGKCHGTISAWPELPSCGS